MVDYKDSRITFGIDLLPQRFPQAKTPPKYALVILEEGAVVKRLEAVSGPRLLRLIHRHRPDVVAVDNVYELAADSDVLRLLVSKLPAETKMVQVTGPPSEAVTLQRAALEYGLKPPSSLSPLEGAEASARLAELGAGSKIEVMENETKILVSRRVSLGSGGSSQSRYRRRVHTTILAVAKRIKEALDKAGVDYDLYEERSDFGLERAEFTAYAPRESLHGLLRPWHGSYVHVMVKPVFKEHVEFVQREPPRVPPHDEAKPRKKLIVGVDPGTTCGLAVLSLDSKPLYLTSRRGLTRGEINRIIVKLGEPVIVASDVVPPPEFVAKLARALDAALFTPEAPMEVVDKRDIAQAYSRQHGIELKDSHMRDALVASVKAFQHHRNKFEQVEAHAKDMGVRVPLDEAKAMVVKGQSIQRAFEALMPRPDRGTVEKPPEGSVVDEKAVPQEANVRELRERALFYRGQVERIRESNRRLRRMVKSLKGEIARLRSALEEVKYEQTKTIRREREYRILQSEVETLRRRLEAITLEAEGYKRRLETLRHYRGLESKGEVLPLKPVETFTRDGVERAFQLYNVNRGDIIILIDSSGGGVSTAEELAKRGVRAVIYGTPMAHQAEETLRNYGVSVIPSEGLGVEWIEGYPYARASDIEEAIGRAQDRERLEAERRMESIVKGYREERAKALEKG